MKTIIITILLVFTTSSAFANIWRVNNNSIYTQGCSNCFTQLQNAIDNQQVLPGDTIHLEASSTNYDAATINKKLVIIGPGYFLNENGSLQQNIQSAIIDDINIEAGGEGSILIGVNIEGKFSTDANLFIDASNIKILRCKVYGTIYLNSYTTNPINNITISQCFVEYIYQISSNKPPVNNLLVTNCYIEKSFNLSNSTNNYNGIFSHNVVRYTSSGSNGIDYFNNIFIDGDGLNQDKNSSTNVYNNIFISGVPSWLSSSSNISIAKATVFVANGSTDGIHKLNPPTICPQCYTGYPNSTEQIGIFGGTTPYILSGIAPTPTIYELKNRPSSYQGDTIHIKISTRSND